MSVKRGNFYVGTSGWSYDWDNFYPEDIAKARRLQYYCDQFPTAEVNYSFYRLPGEKTYKKWQDETNDSFQFVLKMSRFITHIKRLKGIKQPLRKFFKRATKLENQIGPFLIQLPPSFKIDCKRLRYFFETAEDLKNELYRDDFRFAVEPRHPSWYQNDNEREEMLEIFKENNVAFVFAHSSKYPYPDDEPITADFLYLRFHGPEKLFGSPYYKEGLEPFARNIKKWLKKNKNIYAFFNNDMNGYAPDDAQTLQKLVHPT